MRRLIALALLLALPVVASAQTLSQGSVLNRATTAVTVANTTTGTTLYSTTIPAALFQNFTPTQAGATALHLRLLGSISTNPSAGSVGNLNIGCNYGGTTATISLANGLLLTQNLSSAVLFLDLWLRTNTSGAPLLTGRLHIPAASITSVNGGVTSNGPGQVQAAQVTGTTSITSPQTLACAAQWASAAATNTLTISTGVLVVGD